MMKLLPLLAAMSLAASPAFAGFQAHRIGAPDAVKLDGVVDDAVWSKAVAHDVFYENAPQDKIPAKYRTEVKLAYDSAYLYVAVKAFDDKPELIRAPFIRRDKVSGDQDFVGLFIDPSGGGTSAQIIYFNPRGAFTDGNFSNAQGEDEAPDFDFDIVTGRFDGGWSAELRIPFSSLAYKAGETKPWNLLVMRNVSRDQRYKMFSGQVTRSSNCLLCFSDKIQGLEGLPTGLNWTATPQVVARKGREKVAGQPDRSYSGKDFSLDVKVRPDSATIIDATINPDFSQIELDAPQLSGNTRFALFVPEKRPFFLDGSDIYQTPMNVISTRSMTEPQWGARYTRRDAKADITALTVRDVGGGVVMLPHAYHTDYANQDLKSQSTVARANFKMGKLSAGAVATDRTYADSRGYNRVAGADFNWQKTDDESLRGQLLGSATTAQANSAGQLFEGARSTGYAGRIQYSNHNDKRGLFVMAEVVDRDFRADNGFFSQAGYKVGLVEWINKFGKTGIFNEFEFYMFGERKIDSHGDEIYTDAAAGFWMAGPLDTQVNVRVRPFNTSRVVEGGKLHDRKTVWGRIDSSPSRVFSRLSAEVEYGDQVDVSQDRSGRGGFASLYGRLRPADRIEIEPSYSTFWVEGISGPETGKRLYIEHALQINAIYHFGPRDTVRMILQKSRATRDPAYYTQAVPARSNSGTSSFVYGHTAGLGTAAYVGLTLSDGETPGFDPKRRQNELFVKLSWQI
jgi:hypothetical protein